MSQHRLLWAANPIYNFVCLKTMHQESRWIGLAWPRDPVLRARGVHPAYLSRYQIAPTQRLSFDGDRCFRWSLTESYEWAL
jgi:hypothetical protein